MFRKRNSTGELVDAIRSPTRAISAPPPPPVSSRPPVEERHTWTRPNQTLLLDKAKETESIKTFHIPLRLPPVGDAFRAFIYADQGDLGIEDARPPFVLVGLVIEVMVAPFKCKTDGPMKHLEGDIFELPTPLAKPIYGLVEDRSSMIHAIAVSLIKPKTLIKGFGLTDKAFNWAGFPPKVGKTDTPAEDQSLVMGIQRHQPHFCPLGISPVFRVGWESARSISFLQ